MKADIGIIFAIAGLMFALWFGLRDIGTTLERELTLLRTESRVNAMINGYATLRMVGSIVNKGKNYDFEQYLEEINKIRKKTETAGYIELGERDEAD